VLLAGLVGSALAAQPGVGAPAGTIGSLMDPPQQRSQTKHYSSEQADNFQADVAGFRKAAGHHAEDSRGSHGRCCGDSG
jgi:hypothetical protein